MTQITWVSSTRPHAFYPHIKVPCWIMKDAMTESPHPFADYQVMIDDRTVSITELDRDQLIQQLALCIDRMEAVDTLSTQLTGEIWKFRKGN